MLDPDAIPSEVIEKIQEGQWAQGALKQVIEQHAAQFKVMDDPYLRERGNDVLELGNRLLGHIERRNKRRQHFPRDTILVGDDLGVADIARVPRERLLALVSGRGSVNSHLAILAEAMGIPTVMGVKDLPMALIDGGHLIVDGQQGAVITSPSRAQRDLYARLKTEELTLTKELELLAPQKCRTPDGHRTRLWVNTGLLDDAVRSLDRGAEGVGLYRTEIHFMSSDTFPTEEEQRQIYRAHLEAFSPRPVTMRTLDIGGDKSLPYFPIQEDNPFLGWRGVRVSLDHPEIFIAQIRAMIRASEGLRCHLRIMLPMISSVSEVDAAKRLIDQCYREISEEGAEVKMPEVGVMIEVPAAVYQAEAILERVDFLSVGSNDLVQYMLAVDRNNPQVAKLFQEFHPSVLHALNHVAKVGLRMGKGVGICGEMAGHPEAALLLMAMGYPVLSMNMTNLLPVKKALSTISLEIAKQTLEAVLKLDTSEAIKAKIDRVFRREGLGSLIRGPGGRQRERRKR
ncbi:MAG: phosphoenolpyruvate--protein phosphotransferase, partial [Pseudomonadales bacterium]